jgi:hypothetical protein
MQVIAGIAEVTAKPRPESELRARIEALLRVLASAAHSL